MFGWMATTVDGSAGATTIHLGVGNVTAPPLRITNNGNGANIVDIATNSVGGGGVGFDFIALTGSSTVATTINAGGSAGTDGGTTGAANPQMNVVEFLTP